MRGKYCNAITNQSLCGAWLEGGVEENSGRSVWQFISANIAGDISMLSCIGCVCGYGCEDRVMEFETRAAGMEI